MKLTDINVPIIGSTITIDPDEWAVVVSYGSKYFVKPADGITDVFESLRNDEVLSTMDALDYATPYRPVQTPQGMALTRDNIISPVDATCEEVRMYLRITMVYALQDMKDTDKSFYKRSIEDALTQRRDQRRSRSNIKES